MPQYCRHPHLHLLANCCYPWCTVVSYMATVGVRIDCKGNGVLHSSRSARRCATAMHAPCLIVPGKNTWTGALRTSIFKLSRPNFFRYKCRLSATMQPAAFTGAKPAGTCDAVCMCCVQSACVLACTTYHGTLCFVMCRPTQSRDAPSRGLRRGYWTCNCSLWVRFVCAI